ncbi:Uncharacterized protein GBIM_08525, partial [Gryllus bimaculatus]
MEGTFNSCINVQMPSTGHQALDMMCGNYEAAKCDYVKWFSFMGHENTPLVPFPINYFPEENADYTPEDVPYFTCDQVWDEGDEQCSCMDCKNVCLPYELEEEKPPFTINGTDGVAVVMAIVFALLALGITIGVLVA